MPHRDCAFSHFSVCAGRLMPNVIIAIAAVLGIHPAASQDWKPQRNIDIIVNSGAGGAADRQSRVVQKFLQSVPAIPSVSVTNRVGGGGTIAMTFLTQHPGDAHYIGVLSTSLLTNHIVGVSHIRYQDLTPLNILMREYVLAWVRADSPITSSKDLVARLKRDPKSVSFGFSTAPGNQNHVVIGMIARAARIDPKNVKIVLFASGGQGMTAALGGHVDVWVGTPGGAIPHLLSGTVRALGISASQRQPGPFAAVPTFREHDIDAVYYAWRGFIGPKSLTPPQIAFWDSTFAKMVQSNEWRKELDDNAWSDDFRGSADTRKHLDAEYELLRKMLADLGVIAR
jgi:putative tricarboxylic transport membrane protein